MPGLAVPRALPPAPEDAASLRARLHEVAVDFCAAIRAAAAAEQGLGDILMAVRLGPLAPGEVGLVVAAAASRWHPAVAAVQSAVTHLRSIELQ